MPQFNLIMQQEIVALHLFYNVLKVTYDPTANNAAGGYVITTGNIPYLVLPVGIFPVKLTYDPTTALEYLGQGQHSVQSIGYTVSNAHGSTSSTIQVDVQGVNDPPVITQPNPLNIVITDFNNGNPTILDLNSTHVFNTVDQGDSFQLGNTPVPFNAYLLDGTPITQFSNIGGAIDFGGTILYIGGNINNLYQNNSAYPIQIYLTATSHTGFGDTPVTSSPEYIKIYTLHPVTDSYTSTEDQLLTVPMSGILNGNLGLMNNDFRDPTAYVSTLNFGNYFGAIGLQKADVTFIDHNNTSLTIQNVTSITPDAAPGILDVHYLDNNGHALTQNLQGMTIDHFTYDPTIIYNNLQQNEQYSLVFSYGLSDAQGNTTGVVGDSVTIQGVIDAPVIIRASNPIPATASDPATPWVLNDNTPFDLSPGFVFSEPDQNTFLSFQAYQIMPDGITKVAITDSSYLNGWLSFDGSQFFGTTNNSVDSTPLHIELIATVTETDGNSNTFSASTSTDFYLEVSHVTANSASYSVNENDSKTILISDLLTNDSDSINAPFSLASLDLSSLSNQNSSNKYSTHIVHFNGLVNGQTDLSDVISIDMVAGVVTTTAGTYNLNGAAPVSITYTPITGNIDTFENNQMAHESFNYTIKDIYGSASSSTVSLNVNEIAPSIVPNAILDTPAETNVAYTIPNVAVAFTDVDPNDSLIYNAYVVDPNTSVLHQLHSFSQEFGFTGGWLTINPTTNDLSGTPQDQDASSSPLTVEIIASDFHSANPSSTTSATYTFHITQVSTTPPPVANPDTFSMNENDTKTILISDLISGQDDGSGIFIGKDTDADNNYPLNIYTLDLGAAAAGDSVTFSNNSVLHDVSYIDMNNHLVTTLQTTLSLRAGVTPVSFTFKNPYVNMDTEEYNSNNNPNVQFHYSVIDSLGLVSNVTTVKVNINEVAPTVSSPITDQVLAVGKTLFIQDTSTAFHDVDPNETLSYSAAIVDASGTVIRQIGVNPDYTATGGWLTFYGTTLTGTPHASDINDVNHPPFFVAITATDAHGTTVLSATDTFQVTVAQPPVANNVTVSSVAENSSETILISDLISQDTNPYPDTPTIATLDFSTLDGFHGVKTVLMSDNSQYHNVVFYDAADHLLQTTNSIINLASGVTPVSITYTPLPIANIDSIELQGGADIFHYSIANAYGAVSNVAAVNIPVSEVPPLVNANNEPGAQVINVGQNLYIQDVTVPFSDVDTNDQLTYSATWSWTDQSGMLHSGVLDSGPSGGIGGWLTFNGTILSGIPQASNFTDYFNAVTNKEVQDPLQVTITATDSHGANSVSNSYIVPVEVPVAPTANNYLVSTNNSFSIDENNTIAIPISEAFLESIEYRTSGEHPAGAPIGLLDSNTSAYGDTPTLHSLDLSTLASFHGLNSVDFYDPVSTNIFTLPNVINVDMGTGQVQYFDSNGNDVSYNLNGAVPIVINYTPLPGIVNMDTFQNTLNGIDTFHYTIQNSLGAVSAPAAAQIQIFEDSPILVNPISPFTIPVSGTLVLPDVSTVFSNADPNDALTYSATWSWTDPSGNVSSGTLSGTPTSGEGGWIEFNGSSLFGLPTITASGLPAAPTDYIMNGQIINDPISVIVTAMDPGANAPAPTTDTFKVNIKLPSVAVADNYSLNEDQLVYIPLGTQSMHDINPLLPGDQGIYGVNGLLYNDQDPYNPSSSNAGLTLETLDLSHLQTFNGLNTVHFSGLAFTYINGQAVITPDVQNVINIDMSEASNQVEAYDTATGNLVFYTLMHGAVPVSLAYDPAAAISAGTLNMNTFEFNKQGIDTFYYTVKGANGGISTSTADTITVHVVAPNVAETADSNGNLVPVISDQNVTPGNLLNIPDVSVGFSDSDPSQVLTYSAVLKEDINGTLTTIRTLDANTHSGFGGWLTFSGNGLSGTPTASDITDTSDPNSGVLIRNPLYVDIKATNESNPSLFATDPIKVNVVVPPCRKFLCLYGC